MDDLSSQNIRSEYLETQQKYATIAPRGSLNQSQHEEMSSWLDDDNSDGELDLDSNVDGHELSEIGQRIKELSALSLTNENRNTGSRSSMDCAEDSDNSEENPELNFTANYNPALSHPHHSNAAFHKKSSSKAPSKSKSTSQLSGSSSAGHRVGKHTFEAAQGGSRPAKPASEPQSVLAVKAEMAQWLQENSEDSESSSTDMKEKTVGIKNRSNAHDDFSMQNNNPFISDYLESGNVSSEKEELFSSTKGITDGFSPADSLNIGEQGGSPPQKSDCSSLKGEILSPKGSLSGLGMQSWLEEDSDSGNDTHMNVEPVFQSASFPNSPMSVQSLNPQQSPKPDPNLRAWLNDSDSDGEDSSEEDENRSNDASINVPPNLRSSSRAVSNKNSSSNLRVESSTDMHVDLSNSPTKRAPPVLEPLVLPKNSIGKHRMRPEYESSESESGADEYVPMSVLKNKIKEFEPMSPPKRACIRIQNDSASPIVRSTRHSHNNGLTAKEVAWLDSDSDQSPSQKRDSNIFSPNSSEAENGGIKGTKIGSYNALQLAAMCLGANGNITTKREVNVSKADTAALTKMALCRRMSSRVMGPTVRIRGPKVGVQYDSEYMPDSLLEEVEFGQDVSIGVETKMCLEMLPPALGKYRSLILDTTLGATIPKTLSPRFVKHITPKTTPGSTPKRTPSKSPMLINQPLSPCDSGGGSDFDSDSGDSQDNIIDFLDEISGSDENEALQEGGDNHLKLGSAYSIVTEEGEIKFIDQSEEDSIMQLSPEDRKFLLEHQYAREVLLGMESLHLSSMPLERQIMLMKQLTFERFTRGEAIISKGESASRFYIVIGPPREEMTRGETAGVAISSVNKNGNEEKEICHLGVGQYFGERALVYRDNDGRVSQDSTRSATVRVASSVVDVASVGSENFDSWGEFRTYLIMSEVPLLKRLPPASVAAIQRTLHPIEFEAGSYIVRQGDMGDAFYMITKGSVDVLDETPDARGNIQPKVLVPMYEGHIFGELSLIFDEPRNASVRAVTHVTCLFIGKEDFRSCLNEKSFQDALESVVHQRYDIRERREEIRQAEEDKMKYKLTSQEDLLQRSSSGLSAASTGESPSPRIRSFGRLSLGGKRDSFVDTPRLNKRHLNGRKIINKYKIINELGRGQYGTVHLCEDLDSGKKYAMKVLDKKRKGHSRDDLHEVLKREVQTMKMLRHPNIVTLWEVIDDPKAQQLFMIQDYMEKGPLLPEGVNVNPVNVEYVRPQFIDCVRGLYYLHKNNIIHGDIKPANLLLSQDGVIKIADFGAAVFYQDVDSANKKFPKLIGTPAFMAPELYEDQALSRMSPASDIWALGVTLCQMVYGTLPFWSPSGNQVELEHQIKHKEFSLSADVQQRAKMRGQWMGTGSGVARQTRVLNDSTWGYLNHLIKRLLDKDPMQRISLQAVMEHPWVTLEGTVRLPPLSDGEVNASSASLASDRDMLHAWSQGSPSRRSTGASFLTASSNNGSPTHSPMISSPSMLSMNAKSGSHSSKSLTAPLPSDGRKNSPSGRTFFSDDSNTDASSEHKKENNVSSPSRQSPRARQQSWAPSVHSRNPSGSGFLGSNSNISGKGTPKTISNLLKWSSDIAPTSSTPTMQATGGSLLTSTSLRSASSGSSLSMVQFVSPSNGGASSSSSSSNSILGNKKGSNAFSSMDGSWRDGDQVGSIIVASMSGRSDDGSQNSIQPGSWKQFRNSIQETTEITIEVQSDPGQLNRVLTANADGILGRSHSAASNSMAAVASSKGPTRNSMGGNTGSTPQYGTARVQGKDPKQQQALPPLGGLRQFSSAGQMQNRGLGSSRRIDRRIASEGGCNLDTSVPSFTYIAGKSDPSTSLRHSAEREEVNEDEAMARSALLERKEEFLLVPTALYGDGQGNLSKKAIMFQTKRANSSFSASTRPLKSAALSDNGRMRSSSANGRSQEKVPPSAVSAPSLGASSGGSYSGARPVVVTSKKSNSRSFSLDVMEGQDLVRCDVVGPHKMMPSQGSPRILPHMESIAEVGHDADSISSSKSSRSKVIVADSKSGSDTTPVASDSEEEEDDGDFILAVDPDDMDDVLPEPSIAGAQAGDPDLSPPLPEEFGWIDVTAPVQARTWAHQVNLILGLRFGHAAEQGNRDTMEDRTTAVADLFTRVNRLSDGMKDVQHAQEQQSILGVNSLLRTMSEEQVREQILFGPEGESFVRSLTSSSSFGAETKLSGEIRGREMSSLEERDLHSVAFFGIYDGHGGYEVAEALQEHMHIIVSQQRCLQFDPALALERSCLIMDDKCLARDFERMCQDKRATDANDNIPTRPPKVMEFGGAAASMVVIHKGNGPFTRVYAANVGDCRVVLCRGGRAFDLTRDHKPNLTVEKERIEAAGGYISRGRLNGMLGVTRAFGDITFKVYPPPEGAHLWGPYQHLISCPETTKVEVLPQDSFIIIACDGVWDVMNSQQAVDFVQRRLLVHADVQRASRELTHKAIDLFSTDNCSCIIVCLNQLDRTSAPPTVPASPALPTTGRSGFF